MATIATFDRLGSGELVAILTHEGRSVAAIVHPPRATSSQAEHPGALDATERPWSLAGDLDPGNIVRPCGLALSATAACAAAAEALGIELGIPIDGWEVQR